MNVYNYNNKLESEKEFIIICFIQKKKKKNIVTFTVNYSADTFK